MKADISNIRVSDRNISSYRRVNGFYKEIAVIDPSNGSAIVTARIYMPATTAYVCLWVHGSEIGVGFGKAGGGGYHKASAALSEAIKDAGIILTDDIGGRGAGAMESACMAIAAAVSGKFKLILHVAHP